MSCAIVPLAEAHGPALRAFLDALPDRDLTFIKEDVRDRAAAAAWARRDGPARR